MVQIHTIFITNMFNPPVLEKFQKMIGIVVFEAFLSDMGKLAYEFLMQAAMVSQTRKAVFFEKIFFYIEMDVRVFSDHVDYRLKHIFPEFMLHRVVEGVNGGNDSPVLFVDDRYSQIIFGLPNDKNITINQVFPTARSLIYFFVLVRHAVLCFAKYSLNFLKGECTSKSAVLSTLNDAMREASILILL